jgi:hypothetical protein
MGKRPRKFLDQVREAIRLKHYSIRTEEAYVNWIKHYIRFHGKRHLQEMGADEIRAYLPHLAVEKRVAASTQNEEGAQVGECSFPSRTNRQPC